MIGNSDYKSIVSLSNPGNDATDISKILKQIGFKVTLIVNADYRTIEDEILKFGRDLNKGGVGLFFYAGHGVQINGRNYLLPIDANIESESDVKYEAVDVGRVLGKMEDAGNGLNIIILDACRNNPYKSQFRSISRGLARMSAPTGSILAYSTAPDSIALDGKGRNGLYTSKLIKYMSNEGLPIEDCFKKVRVEVINESNRRQVPWETSSLTDKFYFVPPKEPISYLENNSRVESYEIAYWKSVEKANAIEQYRSYVNKYPNGIFIDLAKIRINEMNHNSTSIPALEKKSPLAIVDSDQNNVSDNVPGLVRNNSGSKSRIRLAFFMDEYNNNGLGWKYLSDQFEVLKESILQNENIDLVYADIFSKSNKRNLFTKQRNMFSSRELDVYEVSNYCKDIDVNTAIIILEKPFAPDYSSSSTNMFEILVVDVDSKEVIYSRKKECILYNLLEEVKSEIDKSLEYLLSIPPINKFSNIKNSSIRRSLNM